MMIQDVFAVVMDVQNVPVIQFVLTVKKAITLLVLLEFAKKLVNKEDVLNVLRMISLSAWKPR